MPTPRTSSHLDRPSIIVQLIRSLRPQPTQSPLTPPLLKPRQTWTDQLELPLLPVTSNQSRVDVRSMKFVGSHRSTARLQDAVPRISADRAFAQHHVTGEFNRRHLVSESFYMNGRALAAHLSQRECWSFRN
jgi:hypothetical protein